MAQRKPCSCLCNARVNTAKVDPEDGRLVWVRKFTFTDSSIPAPSDEGDFRGVGIRPIHDGTNDLALALYGFQTNKTKLLRISNRGKKVWQKDCQVYWPHHRPLDTAPDGSISYYGNNGTVTGLFRLDGDGNEEWSNGFGLGVGLTSHIAKSNSNILFSYLGDTGFFSGTLQFEPDGDSTLPDWNSNYWRYMERTTDDIWAQGGNFIGGYGFMAKNGTPAAEGEVAAVINAGASDADGLYCVANLAGSAQHVRFYSDPDTYSTLRVLNPFSSGASFAYGMTKNSDALFMSGFISFFDEDDPSMQVVSTDLDGNTLWKRDINALPGAGEFYCCMGDDGYLYVTGREADKV